MLDKSGNKAAVGRNIATEMGAGRPQKQAVAIALDVQRRAGGKVAQKPKRRQRRRPAEFRDAMRQQDET